MKKFLIPMLIATLFLFAGCSSQLPAASPSPEVTGEESATPSEEIDEDMVATMKLEVPMLPNDTTLLDETSEDDGTYRTELLFEGAVQIVNESVQRVGADEESVEAQIKSLVGSDVKDFSFETDDALIPQLTYPVWRTNYITGANEDTCTNVDIYIQTDTMDYWFHTSTSVDLFEDYAEDIEAWINSLVLSD